MDDAGVTADVVNSSWTGTTSPSGSNDETVGIDALAYLNPRTLVVFAAGNTGAGPNQVLGPPSGYNHLTVAALGPHPTYDAPSAFSSGGPNDYFDSLNGLIPAARQVVDLAAPGQQIGAAYYGGTTGGNGTTDHPSVAAPAPGGPASGPASGPDFYSRSLQGTSFAAPAVAGGAALLYDAAYALLPGQDDARDARVIKAVLMNSADKTVGWDNGQAPHPNGLGGVETFQGLDNRVGTGALNLDRAYDQFLAGTTDVPGTAAGDQGLVDPVGWDFGVARPGTNDYYFAAPLAGGSTFTATLTWFRDRLILENNDSFDVSYDDLDLELWSVDGGLPASVIAESISEFNNSEHFSFALPASGAYVLRVRRFGEVFDFLGDDDSEAYGLAWHAAAVPEPATAVLALLALAALACRLRR
jgi:hypothetical protein